eukprot:scaffold28.g7559.t1
MAAASAAAASIGSIGSSATQGRRRSGGTCSQPGFRPPPSLPPGPPAPPVRWLIGWAPADSRATVAAAASSPERSPAERTLQLGHVSKQLAAAAEQLRQRLREAVQAEWDEEAETLAAAQEGTSLPRLVREGAVLPHLRAAPGRRLYAEFLWVFSLPPAPTAEHNGAGSDGGRGAAARGGDGGSAGGQRSGAAGARQLQQALEEQRRRRCERQQQQLQQQLGQRVVDSPLRELPYHTFGRGDPVRISSGALRRRSALSGGGSSDDDAGGAEAGGRGAQPPPWVDGTVAEVARGHLAVAVSLEASRRLAECGERATFRIDRGVLVATLRRQLSAVDRLTWPPADGGGGGGGGEAALLAILLGSPLAPDLSRRPPEWARGRMREGWVAGMSSALQALGASGALNQSQQVAVAAAASQSLTLWQGPPGTGKTRTLLALLKAVCGVAAAAPALRRTMGPVLAVADTNAGAGRRAPASGRGPPGRPLAARALAGGPRRPRRRRSARRRSSRRGRRALVRSRVLRLPPSAAADNLLEGLLARGVRAVRAGAPSRVREELRAACVDAVVEASEEGRLVASLRDRAEQLQVMPPSPPLGPADAAWGRWREQCRGRRRQADELWKRADDLAEGAADEVLAGAQAVVCTCNGAGEPRLAGRTYRFVVVDEASQATEPACLVALLKGAECVALGLAQPLFGRLAGAGLRFLMLKVQYRMHPSIAAFPSAHFYGGEVQSGATPADRPAPRGLPWPAPALPVLLRPVAGCEARARADGDGSGRRGGGEEGASYQNEEEAAEVMRVLAAAARDPSLVSCAVLTPYSGQARLLAAKVRAAAARAEAAAAGADGAAGGAAAGGAAAGGAAGAGASAALLSRVVVSTVDGFQGREADLIVLSTVRSNPERRLGFLSDERRLNVAITRAKRGLVVVGNPDTLSADPHWGAWLAWLAAATAAARAERRCSPMGPPIVLYASTSAATSKAKSDISRLRLLLDLKRVDYEELHVGGKLVGTAEEVQELEDWGELSALLAGEAPQPLAALDLQGQDGAAGTAAAWAAAATAAAGPAAAAAAAAPAPAVAVGAAAAAGAPGPAVPAPADAVPEDGCAEEPSAPALADATGAAAPALADAAAPAAAALEPQPAPGVKQTEAANEPEPGQAQDESAAAAAALTAAAFAAALAASRQREEEEQWEREAAAAAAALVGAAIAAAVAACEEGEAAAAAADLTAAAFAEAVAVAEQEEAAARAAPEPATVADGLLMPAPQAPTEQQQQQPQPADAAATAAAASALAAVRQLAAGLIDRVAGARLAPLSFPTSASPSPAASASASPERLGGDEVQGPPW